MTKRVRAIKRRFFETLDTETVLSEVISLDEEECSWLIWKIQDFATKRAYWSAEQERSLTDAIQALRAHRDYELMRRLNIGRAFSDSHHLHELTDAKARDMADADIIDVLHQLQTFGGMINKRWFSDAQKAEWKAWQVILWTELARRAGEGALTLAEATKSPTVDDGAE